MTRAASGLVGCRRLALPTTMGARAPIVVGSASRRQPTNPLAARVMGAP